MTSYSKIQAIKMRQLIRLCWALSILLVLLDTLVNYIHNPPWMLSLNIALITALLVSLIFITTLKHYTNSIFIVYVYAFTAYMYLPVFIGGNELRLSLLNSTTRMAACMVYIPLIAYFGHNVHALIAGLLNVAFIFAALMLSHFSISIDPVVIALYVSMALVFYVAAQINDRAFKEYSQSIKSKEEFITQRLEEETKRSSFLQQFLKEYHDLLKELFNTADEGEHGLNELQRGNALKEIKKICQDEKCKLASNENVLWYKITESAFVTSLKINYPNLSSKELLMCMLIVMKYQNKEIADKLNLSIETIKIYKKKIKRKMGITNDQNMTSRLEELHKTVLDDELGLWKNLELT